MKAIYQNKIFDISSVSEPDEHNNFILLLSSETEEVKVTAIAYQYYEYEFQPLLFSPQPMSEYTKLSLIQKFDEWYPDRCLHTIRQISVLMTVWYILTSAGG